MSVKQPNRPGGVPLATGAVLKNPDLAKTFRLIARQGPDVFYRGEIGQAIVAAQRRSRTPVAAEGVGRMTMQDLADYRVVIREPVSVNYRGWTVAAMSPPSSGGLTVGQMLEMVERFPSPVQILPSNSRTRILNDQKII